MLLLSDSPIIALSPLAEKTFALGQKPFSTIVKSLFRPRAKGKRMVVTSINTCIDIH